MTFTRSTGISIGREVGGTRVREFELVKDDGDVWVFFCNWTFFHFSILPTPHRSQLVAE